MNKIRLDQYLVEHGYAESREKSKAIIMSGAVFLHGKRAEKPGMMLSDSDIPEIHGNPLKYVSRGGLKLEKALNVFPVSPAGKVCIDCGASTGGFTDVLLRAGANRVYAVDVGYGQLAWKIRNDERVINLERVNLRYLTKEHVPELLDLAVMDVSFISIRLILPVVKQFLKTGADYICLIKPQFEAGREFVGKKGVVRDSDVHCQVIESCLHSAKECGYRLMGLNWSPVRGPEGNIEFLCYLKNEDGLDYAIDIEETVRAAHDYFEQQG